jgi:hypothetical protein
MAVAAAGMLVPIAAIEGRPSLDAGDAVRGRCRAGG